MEPPNFIYEFIEEAKELNDRFSKICQELAYSGGSKKLIDEAFRVIHTIKGTGASVGCKELAAKLHLLENQLDQMRLTHDNPVSPEVIDQLMEWDSAIAKCLDGLQVNPNHSLSIFESPLLQAIGPRQEEGSQASLDHKHQDPTPETASDLADPTTIATQVLDAMDTSPLHFRSFFLSRKSISEDLAWAFVALSRLALVSPKQCFAEKALEILRDQCNMNEIDRVCLVRRVGLSSQFIVISSATTDANNPMPYGSYCFVASNGSVFNMPRGTIRTIDVNKMIESYKRQNHPPQKALLRLHKFGYQSGAMIPIHNRGRLDGLIFLNSKTTKLHECRKNWYPILAMLSLYSTIQLQECPLLCEHYYFLFSENIDLLSTGPFSIKKLESTYEALATHLYGPRVQFDLMEDLTPFIVSHGHIAYLLASVYSHQQHWSPTIKISIKDQQVYFECPLPEGFSQFHQATLVKIWDNKAKALGFNTLINNWVLNFYFPSEPQHNPNISYSAA